MSAGTAGARETQPFGKLCRPGETPPGTPHR